MFAITSAGQLIAALVMLFAMMQVVFAATTPVEDLGFRTEESSGSSFIRMLMMVFAGIAVLACTAYVIMRGLGI